MTAFAALHMLAAALTVALSWRALRRREWSDAVVVAVLAACVTGAIVGSRLLFFDFHEPVAGERTLLGALAGGALALAIVAKPLRLDASAFDATTLPAIWGAAVARVGCFAAGCCHGVATTLPWGVRFGPDEGPVHPTQLYEAALYVVIALVLGRVRSQRSGTIALLGVIGVAGVRFVVEPLRESALPAAGLTVVQWSLLGCVLLAALGFRLAARGSRLSALGSRRRAVPRFFLASGVVTAAVILPIRVQQTESDTIVPRTYVSLGASGMVGGHFVTTRGCGGTVVSRTQHAYKVGAVTAEVRQEKGAEVSSGMRASAFLGTDHAGTERFTSNIPLQPGSDGGRTDRIRGGSVVVLFDRPQFGVTAGVIAGELVRANNYPAFGGPIRKASLLPVVGLRVGSTRSTFGEVGFATHEPAPSTMPYLKLGLGLGDSTGARITRFGLSDAGIYASYWRMSQGGFEIQPFASIASVHRYQLGLTLKKRFYIRP